MPDPQIDDASAGVLSPPPAPDRPSPPARTPLEQSLAVQLQTLVELTRLPDEAADEATIAAYLLERIVSVLGAVGGSVVRLDGDRLLTIATHDLAPAFEQLQASRSATDWGFHKRFIRGDHAYLESIMAEAVSPQTLATAEAAGYRAYAAFPIRADGLLYGVLLAAFRQPATELLIDHATLAAIGRIIDIAFANQRLRSVATASESRYRTLFEHSPDALVIQTLDDVVLDANPAAHALYGPGLIGRHVAQLAIIDGAELARQHELILEQGAAAWTGIGRRLDGTTFPEEVETARIRIGGEDRILVLVRDRTERDRLQGELLQAQKMEAIGLLVAGVAHELNNPLAAIVAFSQLIQTDPSLPDELHRNADLLVQESNRTRRIVQNLLDFARQRPPERVPTSLRELVDGVLALQSYTIGPSRIEAILNIPDDIPAIPLDRAQIQQVLVNLTLNAAQAIRSRGERGTIWITAQRARRDDGVDVVRLSLTDDGPGVPESFRSRLFIPFFTTKAPGEGTGLGLSVSFGIVAGHGGTLRHEPGPNGVGASFIVELPVEPGPVPEPVIAATPPGSAQATSVAATTPPLGSALPDEGPADKIRVLVLDDEVSIGEFLARILRRGGYEPTVATNGKAALEIVRREPPDAILCDYRMVGMSGTAFHEAVVEINPALGRRFAFMSGDVLNRELRDFAIARGIGLLAKPFDIETVGQTVARIVAETGPRA